MKTKTQTGSAPTKVSADKIRMTESINEVKNIIDLMGKTNISELEFENPGMKLSIRKHASQAIPQNVFVMHSSPIQDLPAQHSAPVQHRETPVALIAEVQKEAEQKLHKIISPIAGTFYTSPSPTSPLYIQVGESVSVGQAVCIVEAMKLMNEIKSDVAGRIVKVIAANGKSVESGSVLFLVDAGA